MIPVAGAGGIEPPNGGIKIRCLTAWLRPIRPVGPPRETPLARLLRPRRSTETDAPFQQAKAPRSVTISPKEERRRPVVPGPRASGPIIYALNAAPSAPDPAQFLASES